MTSHPIWLQIELQLQALITFSEAAGKMVENELTPMEQEEMVSAICNLKECKNKLATAKQKMERVLFDLGNRKQKEAASKVEE